MDLGPLLRLACGVLVLLWLAQCRAWSQNGCWACRVTDEEGNEALVLPARLGGIPSLAMLDTAYAGAPVLSRDYLHLPACRSAWRTPFRSVQGRVQREYRQVKRQLRARPEPSEWPASSLAALFRTGKCRAYTSGCRMRLMSISGIEDKHTDLLLCSALELEGLWSSWLTLPSFSGLPSGSSDAFVSYELPGSVHILTMDYLMHRAPCVLDPQAQTLHFRVPRGKARGFHFQESQSVGGAPSILIRAGATELRIVLDTGAAVALALAPEAVQRLRTCSVPSESQHVTQIGVHGDRVCSELLHVPVFIGPLDLGHVPTVANGSPVQGCDGYAGMGLLRALTLWLEPGWVGLCRSGLPVRAPPNLARGSCNAAQPLKPRCSSKPY